MAAPLTKNGVAAGPPPATGLSAVHEPAVNQLAELCRGIGLTAKHAAGIAGVAPSVMRQALACPAPPAVNAFLTLCDEIGANLRLKVSPPFELAFDAGRLDALYFDNAFRLAQRLPHPEEWTRYGIRRLVVHQRARLKKTYGQIEDYLQQGHVCTTEGLRAWRRSTAQQHVVNRRKRFPDDDQPIVPDAESRTEWRRWLIQRVAAEAYPTDPLILFRYQMLPMVEEGPDVVLRPRAKVPSVVRRWLLDGMTSLPWLGGAWEVRSQPSDVPPSDSTARVATSPADSPNT